MKNILYGLLALSLIVLYIPDTGPQRKSDVYIEFVNEEEGTFILWATPEAIQELAPYGGVFPLYSNKYLIVVDPRYGLMDVLKLVDPDYKIAPPRDPNLQDA